MKKILAHLLSYNEEANERLIAFAGDVKPANQRIITLLSHIINAHMLWYERINGRESDLDLWQTKTIEELTRLNRSVHKKTDALLNNSTLFELEKLVSYTNSEGDFFRNTVGDILFHIVDHSTWHRSQVSGLLIEERLTPPPTGYIQFVRTSRL